MLQSKIRTSGDFSAGLKARHFTEISPGDHEGFTGVGEICRMIAPFLRRVPHRTDLFAVAGGLPVAMLSLSLHLFLCACLLEMIDDPRQVRFWMILGKCAAVYSILVWVAIELAVKVFRVLRIPEFLALLGGGFALLGTLLIAGQFVLEKAHSTAVPSRTWYSASDLPIVAKAFVTEQLGAFVAGLLAAPVGGQLVVLYPSLALAWFARRSEAFEEACDWVERRMRGRAV
ncbi:MAG: hypothetical protein R3F11_16440 [Verrucomicrobiales bacterium]